MTKDTSYFGKVTNLETRLTDLIHLMDHHIDQQGYSFLEVGCAEGDMTKFMLERYKPGEYIVIEKDPKKLSAFEEKNLPVDEIHCWDIATMEWKPYAQTQFDFILFLGVMHKLSSDKARVALREIMQHTNYTVFIRTRRAFSGIILELCEQLNFNCLFYPSSVEGQGPLFVCERLS